MKRDGIDVKGGDVIAEFVFCSSEEPTTHVSHSTAITSVYVLIFPIRDRLSRKGPNFGVDRAQLVIID